MIRPRFHSRNVTYEYIRKRIDAYEQALAPLPSLLAYGCFFGTSRQNYLWATCLQRLVNARSGNGGYKLLLDLRKYPAHFLMYVGGVVALAQGQYDALAALLYARVRANDSDDPTALALHPSYVLEHDYANKVFGKNHHVPLTEHLYQAVREPVRGVLPDDTDYQRCFDLFEYFHGLVHVDLYTRRGHDAWGPVGAFSYRYGRFSSGQDVRSPQKQVEVEAARAGAEWGVLQAGLFEGSMERFNTVKTEYDGVVQRIAGQRF